MVKDDSKTGESMESLVNLLEKALSNEKVIGKIAEKVAFRMGAPRAEVPITQFWKENLDKAGIDLEEGCTPERIVELYPLSHQEIEGVVNNIKTGKFTGKLNLRILKDYIVKYLGDITLIDRASRKDIEWGKPQPCPCGPGDYPPRCDSVYDFGPDCRGQQFARRCPGFFDPASLDWREKYINPAEHERMMAERQQMYRRGYEAPYQPRTSRGEFEWRKPQPCPCGPGDYPPRCDSVHDFWRKPEPCLYRPRCQGIHNFRYPCPCGPGDYPPGCDGIYKFGFECRINPFFLQCSSGFDKIKHLRHEEYINTAEYERMIAQREQMSGGTYRTYGRPYGYTPSKYKCFYPYECGRSHYCGLIGGFNCHPFKHSSEYFDPSCSREHYCVRTINCNFERLPYESDDLDFDPCGMPHEVRELQRCEARGRFSF
ncbi:MAG: hypothetical protein GY855_01550 [candidate division Zixibacteria bacterium]|nr:hypothetical protein [candidate division Zixibacteria bacterium]